MFIENGKKKAILKNTVEILMCNLIRESSQSYKKNQT